MENKYKVITIGSAVLDIYMQSSGFVKIESDKFEEKVGLCVSYGGKSEVESVVLTTGGAGTNNAVSYGRKGLATAVICEVGDDLIAKTILSELEQEGVDTSMVVKEADEETGLSSIMVSGDGGRAVVVYRGASRMLTNEDIQWQNLSTDWFHISSLGDNLYLLKSLVGHASENGIRVALNPGNIECEILAGDDEARRWILERVEVLIVNREEAEKLSGIKFGSDEVWESGARIEGPRYVVITDGRHGGKVYFDGGVEKYEAIEVETVEETGAGDGFGSGFVAGLMMGRVVGEAIEWGKKQAGSVVGYMGPKRGLMSLEQIQAV